MLILPYSTIIKYFCTELPALSTPTKASVPSLRRYILGVIKLRQILPKGEKINEKILKKKKIFQVISSLNFSTQTRVKKYRTKVID